MGQSPSPRKRATIEHTPPAASPIPDPAISPHVNQSCRVWQKLFRRRCTNGR